MSSTQTACDEDLIRRLPLPLAKIYRRAHSARAKSALELHQASYYLWEASLKLLASTAIVTYAERGEHDAELTECLKKVCRPMLGHWWEFVRRLLPVLSDAGDPGFSLARDLVLGGSGMTCRRSPPWERPCSKREEQRPACEVRSASASFTIDSSNTGTTTPATAPSAWARTRATNAWAWRCFPPEASSSAGSTSSRAGA
jgi:hypothetical protein